MILRIEVWGIRMQKWKFKVYLVTMHRRARARPHAFEGPDLIYPSIVVDALTKDGGFTLAADGVSGGKPPFQNSIEIRSSIDARINQA